MIKINRVSDDVDDRVEERRQSEVTMERVKRIEGDVFVERRAAKMRDNVATHRQKNGRISEHHRRSGAASYRHAVAGDATQTGVFSFKGKI